MFVDTAMLHSGAAESHQMSDGRFLALINKLDWNGHLGWAFRTSRSRQSAMIVRSCLDPKIIRSIFVAKTTGG